MRKRITCGILMLILAISLIPAAALPVSAASNHSFSEKIVNLIKEIEGFNSKAFWDVSQWSIGYGTVSKEGQTITKAKADAALRKSLTPIDKKINEFAGKNGLKFTQKQHDALVSFSFNCGTGWMDVDGRFRNAIIKGTTGSKFLYYISLWANVESVPEPSLIRRRLCEANLYLNGVYSDKVPDEYTYVIFDPNGGTPGRDGEDKMQGYLKYESTSILVANPQKTGKVFEGWYTQSAGGKKVTKLDESTAGKTLYAHYKGDKETASPIAAGTVNCGDLNVRSSAGMKSGRVGSLSYGSKVTIYEIKNADGVQWGRIGTNRWICLDYITQTGISGNSLPYKVKVTKSAVNVRSGPAVSSEIVQKVKAGDKFTVYEEKKVNTVIWGRIGTKLWIPVKYTEVEKQSAGLGTGKVISTTALNVRSGAGTNFGITTWLYPGTKVTILEKKDSEGMTWGRIDRGWVCMTYIQMV